MSAHIAHAGGPGGRQIMGIDPPMRRAWLAHNTGHGMEAVGAVAFEPEGVRGKIENLVGAAQIPLGIAGPIRVNGAHSGGSYYVPFATTEGTLVTTYQYGMRAISEAGCAPPVVLGRAPGTTPCFTGPHPRDPPP